MKMKMFAREYSKIIFVNVLTYESSALILTVWTWLNFQALIVIVKKQKGHVKHVSMDL